MSQKTEKLSKSTKDSNENISRETAEYLTSLQDVNDISKLALKKKMEAKAEALSVDPLILNGRAIVYTNQVPYETDVLRTNLYNMTAIGALAATVLGVGINYTPLVRGFPCVPISPPGLSVLVGSLQTPDVMYSLQPLDATAYGVLPADTTPQDQQFKQGFSYGQQTFATPAPTTSGNTVVHLVQVAFITKDVNDISRPYFNSVDPTSPIFLNNYDTRTDTAVASIKLGTQAPSPVPPTPDPGNVGLYYITVTFGQTSIVTGNISIVPNAPFVSESLTQKVSAGDISGLFITPHQLQTGNITLGTDVGTVNNVIVNPNPAYTGTSASAADVFVFMENTNTGDSTINISTLGAVQIVKMTTSGLVPLTGGEMQIFGWSHFKSNGTHYQLLNPVSAIATTPVVSSWNGSTSPVAVTAGSGITITSGVITNIAASSIVPSDIQQNSFTFAVDVGSLNAYALTPIPSYGTLTKGMSIKFIAGNTNTGASTLNVNGGGATSILVTTPTGNHALTGGEIQGGGGYEVLYDGSSWVLLNPSIEKKLISQVSQMANQVLTPGSYNIIFDTVDFDTSAWWVGSPLYNFMPTVAGYYNINTIIGVQSSAVGQYIIRLYKTGTLYEALVGFTVTATFTSTINAAIPIYLNGTTDYVNLVVAFTNSNLTLSNSIFSIEYLGTN